MRLSGFLSFSVMFVLMFSAMATALPAPMVDISLSSEKDAVYPGNCNKYVVLVENLDGRQRVDYSVEGEKLSWVSLTSAYTDFDTREPQNISFYLCPTIGSSPGAYKFTFKARSRTNDYLAELPVPIYIIERPYLEVRDVLFSKDTYKIGEIIEVTANVKNLGVVDAKNTRLWIEIEGANPPEKIRAEIPLIEANRGKSISEKIVFDRFKSRGKYTITASIVDDIGDVLAKKSGSITIEEKSELQQEINVRNSILSKKVTISASNNGNKKDVLEVKDYGTAFLVLYSFEKQPERIEREGARKAFFWVCELGPGESCSITYRVDYWLLFLAIIVIGGISYVLYNILQKPRIKKHILRRGKEHSVHITIKNKSRKDLRNIEVRDIVPEAVSIISGSLSPAIKPKAKSRRGGMELIWVFSRLAPGEERVISYKIKPVVMVLGKIHLPKAKISAIDETGKVYEAKSPVAVD